MLRNTENALLEGPCRVLATSRHLIPRERSGLGAKARDRLRPIVRLDDAFGSQSAVGDERANIAIRDLGGALRVLCYLWHPTSMTKWPRDFPGCYPTLLPRLRAVALGKLAVEQFSR